jgi:hypothetical protein
MAKFLNATATKGVCEFYVCPTCPVRLKGKMLNYFDINPMPSGSSPAETIEQSIRSQINYVLIQAGERFDNKASRVVLQTSPLSVVRSQRITLDALYSFTGHAPLKLLGRDHGWHFHVRFKNRFCLYFTWAGIGIFCGLSSKS